MEFLFFLGIWVVCGIIAAMIGSKKEQGCGGFIAGILLGPFGILLMLFTKGNRKTCPFCKESIHAEAVVCPRCQRDVTPIKGESSPINTSKTSDIEIMSSSSASAGDTVPKKGNLLLIIMITCLFGAVIIYAIHLTYRPKTHFQGAEKLNMATFNLMNFYH